MSASLVPDLPAVVTPGRLFIDGRFVESLSGKSFDSINPATEEVLTSVSEGDRADIDAAVAAARAAFETGPWPRMRPRDRGRLLLKLADLISANAERGFFGFWSERTSGLIRNSRISSVVF